MNKTKSILILFLPLVFLSLSFTLIFAAEPSPDVNHPRIQFEETVYDFGVAGQREKIRHEFVFKNTGGRPLTIKGARATCGCIAEIVTKKIVEPGESGSITVIFETRQYRGRHEKSVFVESDDPGNPVIELTMAGLIRTDAVVIPRFLYFGDVEKGQEVVRVVKLVRIGSEAFALHKIDSSAHFLSVSHSRLKGERNEGMEIRVRLEPNAPVGKFAEVITLHTSRKKRPRIDVPVAGNVLGRISVTPQMLSMGALKKGETAARKLNVADKDGADLRIFAVDAGVPFISSEVAEVDGGAGFEISFTAAPNAPAGGMNGMITIQTDDPDQPIIKIPFHAMIGK